MLIGVIISVVNTPIIDAVILLDTVMLRKSHDSGGEDRVISSPVLQKRHYILVTTSPDSITNNHSFIMDSSSVPQWSYSAGLNSARKLKLNYVYTLNTADCGE